MSVSCGCDRHGDHNGCLPGCPCGGSASFEERNISVLYGLEVTDSHPSAAAVFWVLQQTFESETYAREIYAERQAYASRQRLISATNRRYRLVRTTRTVVDE